MEYLIDEPPWQPLQKAPILRLSSLVDPSPEVGTRGTPLSGVRLSLTTGGNHQIFDSGFSAACSLGMQIGRALAALAGGLGRRRAENGVEPLSPRSTLAVLKSAGSSLPSCFCSDGKTCVLWTKDRMK
jgi:hypothetical protein